MVTLSSCGGEGVSAVDKWTGRRGEPRKRPRLPWSCGFVSVLS